MEVEKAETASGLLSVKITPEVLESQYIPALEEIMQSQFSGRVAHAVRKNYQYARRTLRAFHKVRIAMMDLYVQRNKKGEHLTTEGENGQILAVFKDEGAGKEFGEKVRELYSEKLFDLSVHRVDERDVTAMAAVRPVALIALEPMFYPDGDLEGLEIPEEFQKLVSSEPEQTLPDHVQQESDLREEAPDTVQAEPLRNEAADKHFD